MRIIKNVLQLVPTNYSRIYIMKWITYYNTYTFSLLVSFIEEELSTASSTSGSSPPSPARPAQDLGYVSYVLVGDNVDKTIRPRHMSMEHQSQSLHYFQCYAALDRVDFRHLPNDSPIGKVSELPMSSFLPNLADCSALRENYAILIGREVVWKLTYFKKFASCIPDHIHHEHSEAMSRKSVLVGISYCWT